METVIVEIRSAEGGEDAKLLVEDQYGIYVRMLARRGFSSEILESSSGLISFRAEGPGVVAAFQHEPGGHRFQRIPPTEKRGRVQTSTITVAVLHEPEATAFYLNPADLDWKTARGSGPGGQNRNKTESCVIVTHKPTGTVVRIDTERSQHRNRELALGILRARLREVQQKAQMGAANDARKAQLGSGMRGDKVVTVRYQDDQVTYHLLNRKLRLSDYLKGNWEI